MSLSKKFCSSAGCPKFSFVMNSGVGIIRRISYEYTVLVTPILNQQQVQENVIVCSLFFLFLILGNLVATLKGTLKRPLIGLQNTSACSTPASYSYSPGFKSRSQRQTMVTSILLFSSVSNKLRYDCYLTAVVSLDTL